MLNKYINKRILPFACFVIVQATLSAQPMPACLISKMQPRWEYEIRQGIYKSDTCYMMEKKRWDTNSSRNEIFVKNNELRKEGPTPVLYKKDCTIINEGSIEEKFTPTGNEYQYTVGSKAASSLAPLRTTLAVNISFERPLSPYGLEKYVWRLNKADSLLGYTCNGNIAIAVFDVDHTPTEEEMNIKNVVPVSFEMIEVKSTAVNIMASNQINLQLQLKQPVKNRLVVCLYYYPGNFYKKVKDLAAIKKANNATAMELDTENLPASSAFQYMAYPSAYTGPATLKKYFFASEKDGSSLLGKGINYHTIYLKTKKPQTSEKINFRFKLHVGNAG